MTIIINLSSPWVIKTPSSSTCLHPGSSRLHHHQPVFTLGHQDSIIINLSSPWVIKTPSSSTCLYLGSSRLHHHQPVFTLGHQDSIIINLSSPWVIKTPSSSTSLFSPWGPRRPGHRSRPATAAVVPTHRRR